MTKRRSFVRDYFRRIGYEGSTERNISTLKALHHAHATAVPFETLDIQMGKAISLNEASLFEKIVRNNRGGFCYELNVSFARLLRRLNFPVSFLSCRVRHGDWYGPAFEHIALCVRLGEPWLVDVGYGDVFLEPLRILQKTPQKLKRSHLWIRRQGRGFECLSRKSRGWKILYRFTLKPYGLRRFYPMCRLQQTSPLSRVKSNLICTRVTSQGKIVLYNQTLTFYSMRKKTQRILTSLEKMRAALRQYFSLHVGRNTFRKIQIPLNQRKGRKN